MFYKMPKSSVYSTCDLSLPFGKKYVAIQLLTLETIYFIVEPKSRVNELFTQVCKYLGLSESLELFGLCIKNKHGHSSTSANDNECKSEEEYIFLDLCAKLVKVAPKQWKASKNGVDPTGASLFTCHFRVQFYVDSYLFISDKIARHHYYLQLKENVVNYGLDSLNDERAFLLASISLQADLGNYNQEKHVHNYFNPDHYFPLWMKHRLGSDFITRNMPTLHQDQKNLTKSEAEGLYIKEASDLNLSPHNLHLYKLYKTTNNSCTISRKFNHYSIENKIWLGICHNGIAIFGENKATGLKAKLSFFSWPDIGKLHFDKKKFEIRSVGFPLRKFTYFTSSEEISKNLLWLCRSTHRFQMIISPKLREIKKREQELTRRKYRESYIYSRDETVSPFDLPFNMFTRKRRDKDDEEEDEATNSCSKVESSDENRCEMNGRNGSNYSSSCKESLCSEQRVSVISNTSSNTTSGIVSDKVQSIEGDSEADDIGVDGYDTIDGNNSPCPPRIPPHMISFHGVHYSLESLAISDHSSGISGDMVRSSSATETGEGGSSSLSSMSPVSLSSVSTNGSTLFSPPLQNNNGTYQWYSNQENTTNCDDSKVSSSGANSTRSTSSEQSIATIKSVVPLSSLSSSSSTLVGMDPSFLNSSSIASIGINISKIGVTTVKSSPVTSLYINQTNQHQQSPNDNSAQNCAKLRENESRRPPKPPIRSESMNHIYENVPYHRPLKRPSTTPPPLPLSLPPRVTPRIGVSSLNRNVNNGSNNIKPNEPYTPYQYKLNYFYPQQNVAGSEPDLYNPKLWSPLGPVTYQSPDFQSLPGINSSYSICVPAPPPYKPTRAHSDPTTLSPPCYHLHHQIVAYSGNNHCPPTVEGQPTFHQSLNDIALKHHPLRLVESDMNVSNFDSIPPPPEYASNNSITPKTSHNMIRNGFIYSQMADGRPKATSEQQLNKQHRRSVPILDLHQLRQKSQDMDLPLITALFNDRSLMLPKTVPTCCRKRNIYMDALNLFEKQMANKTIKVNTYSEMYP